jgi:rod shape-determining protein MreD
MTAVSLIRRVFGVPVALLLALVLQLVIVNRLPLPGGGAPDLVLLAVVATGTMTGPLAGTIAGFCGGLALDVAPPSGHLAGEYALVFCLAGYACGRLRALGDPMEERGSIMSLAVMAVGAAAGEAGKAALGMMLSDPEMTGPVIKHVLPGAILYDLLLCPFVLWLVAAAVRGIAPERMRDPHQRPVRTAPEYGALRLAGAGAAPRLKLGGGSLAGPEARQRREPKLKLGGGSLATTSAPRRRDPKLRLASASSSFSGRTNSGGSPGSLSASARRPVSVNFASSGRSGLTGGSAFGQGLSSASGLKASALRGSAPRGSAVRQSSPGKGWLRAGKDMGGGAAPRKSPGRGWLRSARPAGLAKFSGSALSARPAVPKFRRPRPGRGWLKTSKSSAAPKFRSPNRGWLKSGKPSSSWQRKSPGRGWMKSGKSRKWMGGSR